MSTQTPLGNLFHLVQDRIHGLNDYTMAKQSGTWESGFQPIRNVQNGQQAWGAEGTVGQGQRQTASLTYNQQIDTIGSITNRQPDHLLLRGSQQTTNQSIYQPYQHYTTSSVAGVRAPAQQNQFMNRGLPPSTQNNHCRNATTYTTIASSGIHQNMQLRNLLTQPLYSREMEMFQVPHPPGRSQTSNSQGQSTRIHVSEGQSGVYRNISMPPRSNFPSRQGFPEISSQGSQANHGMRQLHAPSVSHQRPPYPFHPTQRNPSRLDPPMRNPNPRHHIPSTSLPQVHPAFRPSGTVQSVMNPLQMASEQLQSSQDWQVFQQKATMYFSNIPLGPRLGFFFNCRQIYEHYVMTSSRLHPDSLPCTFHEFCEAYLHRQEEIGGFDTFLSAQTTAADVQENEEPSDKSLLGQWYRHPDENQDPGGSTAINQPESSVNNISNDCVVQSSDHVDLPVSATTQDDHSDNADRQEYIITPTEEFKVELNESWEDEQNSCANSEREVEDSEREVEDIEDVIATNKQSDSENESHLTVKLPFHPPSKNKDRSKSLISADQDVIIPNTTMQKLSEVVNQVMVNRKNTADPSSDTAAFTAESISEIESSGADSTRTSLVVEPSMIESDLSKNEMATYSISEKVSPAQQNKTKAVTKRKHSTTEVDPENEIQTVNPSKKQRKNTIDEDAGESPVTNDSELETEKDVRDVDPLQQTKKTSSDKSVFSRSGEMEERGKADVSKDEESVQEDSLPRGADVILSESQRDPQQGAAGSIHSESQKDPLQETSDINNESRLLFPIKFHGEEIVCINCEKGYYLLMREILKKNFACLAQTRGSKDKKNLHSKYFTDVFLAKERDLNIPYKELPEDKKQKVKEYLMKSYILTKSYKGNHIGIIHINDAHRLYQYFFGLKNCRGNCIQLHYKPDNDWTLPNCKTGSSDESGVEDGNGDEREAVVSLEYESDATIPYTEGSDEDDVILIEDSSFSDSHDVSASEIEDFRTKGSGEEVVVVETSLNVKMVEIDASDENSEDFMQEMKEKVESDEMQDSSSPQEVGPGDVNDPTEIGNEGEIELRGGIAPLYGAHFRFLVIDGIKFYPFVDLCKRFGFRELTECMKMRTDNKYKAFRCEQIEADFFNRLEPSLPKIAENDTLLEEEILLDIADQKTDKKTDDVDTPDEDVPLVRSFALQGSHNPEHPEQTTSQNQLPSAELEQSDPISNTPTPDDSFSVREVDSRVVDSREVDSRVVDSREVDSRVVDSRVQNKEEEAAVSSEKNRVPCTPVHGKCSSVDVEICQTNEVSSTMQTPTPEEKQIRRNIAQDFTAADEQQTNKVESSSPEVGCCQLLQNSTENNNNSQSASDTMLNIGVLQKVQETLSRLPPSADTTQIHQALQQFFKTCQETCSESQGIVTEAFVSVLKQNLVLQNELNNLRSGIADLKEEKGKLEDATKKCKEITKEMEDIEDVLLESEET